MAENESDNGSLAARLGAAARASLATLRAARLPERREWHVAAAVALLIAAGPIATMAGAGVLAHGARAEARRLQADVEPRLAAERAATLERRELSGVLRRPTLSATIEALARTLPPEATLLRAERGPQGLLVDIAAPDPDQLRAAIRHEPMLTTLHETGQRQGEAAMIVSLKEQAE